MRPRRGTIAPVCEPIPGPWTHGFAAANGVRLHYVEAAPAGPARGLALLLHGWPEFWYSWRHQLPALAAAGWRAVAPDLRGYNLSDRPRGGYDLATLSQDVVALVGALGAERAALVGHDWGGTIAWDVAMQRPDRVDRLRGIQRRHFLSLFEGTVDEAYFESRLRVGDAHQRIGLEPSWYIGAFAVSLRLAMRSIVRETGEAATVLPVLEALVKRVFLDMSLAMSTYISGGFVSREVASTLRRAAELAEEAERLVRRGAPGIRRDELDLRRVQQLVMQRIAKARGFPL